MLLSIILIAIGSGALLAIMWVMGRFGWTLLNDQADRYDRYASTALHMLVDPGTVALISVSLVCRRGWRSALVSTIVWLFSVVLVCYSVLCVYGFMSAPIATKIEAHIKHVEGQKQAANWQVVVKKTVPGSERMENRQSEERLEHPPAIDPATRAQSIADLFDTTPLRVQRGLVMTVSCVGQIIILVCLFCGFFIWPHKVGHAMSLAPSLGRGGAKLLAQRTANFSTVPSANAAPAVASSSTASHMGELAGSGGRRTSVTDTRPPGKRIPLPKAKSEELTKAAELYAQGGSRWPSIRALSRDFGCHHKTAGDYVRRAQERMASQRMH
jgi:hypothetical protein